MASKRTIVVDIAGRNIADFDVIKSDRHEWPYYELYRALQERGIRVVGADEYLASPEKYEEAVLWRRYSVNSTASQLIEKGVRPGVLMGYESPMYAVLFFWLLPIISRRYPHTFSMGAAKKFVSSKTIFHASFPPQPYDLSLTVPADFKKRKFLTMINGNAGVNPVKRGLATIAQFVRPLPGFDLRELYIDRLLAIEYFSRHSDFDLYGRGWEKPIPYFRGKKRAFAIAAIRRSYRGEIQDKFEKFKEYKFSICFENFICDGWITEKIFDAMFAGCVPVYWGAGDVARFIPPGTFIDFREFKDFKELEDFLVNMDESTYNGYIQQISEFLRSPLYSRFSQKEFIRTMTQVFEDIFDKTA